MSNTTPDADLAVLLQQGFESLRQGDFARAERRAVGARARSPGHPLALNLLALSLHGQGRNAEAIGYIEQLQRLETDAPSFAALFTQLHVRPTSADETLRMLLHEARELEARHRIAWSPPLFPVLLEQVGSLLAEGTRFVIHDAGFRPMMSGAPRDEAAHTRYLPNNKVVLTTEYTIEGERIADTLNGQVEISSAFNDTSIQMGPSSEVILDHMTKNRYLREAAARIPRILHPECFVSATVSA